MGFFNAKGTGFGFGSFGKGKFGTASAGENIVVRSFPVTYLEDDQDKLLYHYLLTIKDRIDDFKDQVKNVSEQVDPLAVREDILRHLGTTIDVEVDDAEPQEFRRSLVNNAVLFYRIKGTKESYRLRGKISGFDVDVLNIYHIDPSYVPYLDPNLISEIPTGSGEFYTQVEPGSVSGIPLTEGCDYCFTSYIKVTFTLVKSLPPASSVNYLDRVIRKIKEVIPIHVRDVLYEIIINVIVNEHDNLKVEEIDQVETLYVPVHVFHNFDVIPADNVSTDLHGYSNGTIEVV